MGSCGYKQQCNVSLSTNRYWPLSHGSSKSTRFELRLQYLCIFHLNQHHFKSCFGCKKKIVITYIYIYIYILPKVQCLVSPFSLREENCMATNDKSQYAFGVECIDLILQLIKEFISIYRLMQM